MKSTPTQSASAAAGRAARAGHLQLATAAVLTASQGPAILPMFLPVAETVMFFRRPHLPTLARSGMIPKPVTAAVSQLTQLGTAAAKQAQGAEKYLEMALALVRACAVIPPAPVVAAMDSVEAVFAALSPKEPLVNRADWPNQRDYELALAMARAEDAYAAAEARSRALTILTEAARGADAGELVALFAQVGAEAEDGQLYLVASPEEAKPGTEDRSVCLHRTDLVEVVDHLFANVPGAMRRFRS